MKFPSFPGWKLQAASVNVRGSKTVEMPSSQAVLRRKECFKVINKVFWEQRRLKGPSFFWLVPVFLRIGMVYGGQSRGPCLRMLLLGLEQRVRLRLPMEQGTRP